MDLGPHAILIWTSYAAVALVIGGLATWLIADARRLRAALADLEKRGIKRRSSETNAEPTR